MNKTIWALAFVVLACGFSFAVVNSTTTEIDQSGFEGLTAAESVTTEGGNVTEVDLGTNASTEKWAGFFGNVSGELVLAEAGTGPYMYRWTYDVGSGGTVCASIGDNPVWTFAAIASGVIDAVTAWDFPVADADSATRTMTNTSGQVTLEGALQPASASLTSEGGTTWQTVAYGTGGATTKDALIFCVNITEGGDNFKGGDSDFQLMAPTNSTVDTTEEYFFYLELI